MEQYEVGLPEVLSRNPKLSHSGCLPQIQLREAAADALTADIAPLAGATTNS